MPRRTLWVVATAHLDSQWRWTLRDTIRDYLPRTLRANFALLDEFPAYVLSFEGAFRYMLVEEYYPRDFARLRAYVAAGRWQPAGAMLDAPDANLPSPESLLRHVLYGNGYFRRVLGRASRDLLLPDGFGFGWALPSIAAHGGLVGFSSQKFIKWMAPARIPFELGIWEGPDGAAVVAALDPEGYGDGIAEDLSRAGRWRERIDRLGRATGLYQGYKYFGAHGDRGGAPSRASCVWLEQARRDPGPLEVVNVASDEPFLRLSAAERSRLPRHRGELLLPVHGTGCLTSQAVLKRWNRKNELLADAAERAAVVADWLGAAPYPAARLREAWIRFLWHQMHDDLTGTSIPAAYRLSWNDEAVAGDQLAAVLADAVGGVARALDTRVEGLPLVVFNPLARRREDVVEARVRFAGEPPAAVRVFGPEGEEVPSQVLARGGGTLDVCFLAALGGVGFAVYDLRSAPRPCALETGLAADVGGLGNARYRVGLDAAGDVASLFDHDLGRELLAAPAGLLLFADRSRRWPAWEVLYEDLAAGPRERFAGPVAARVVERGPARVCVEVVRRCRGSLVAQRLRLAAGAAGGRLEVDATVDWRSRGRLLKAAFPLAAASPVATFDLGLGAIERGMACREKYEVPAQQWADQSSAAEDWGVSVLDDSRYGWDKPDEHTLRLTLARAPRARWSFRHQATQDFGRHRLLYALYGHRGGWADGGTVGEAERLNQPLIAFQTVPHAGSVGRRLDFLEAGRGAVTVAALKRREEGGEIVLRLRETSGRGPAEAAPVLAATVVATREANGVEEPAAEAAWRDGPPALRLEPFQQRTATLRLAPPAGDRLTPPRSLPLTLPFDVVAASFHAAPEEAGDLDGRGHALPGELLPEHVDCQSVRFALGPRQPGAANALACRGQELALAAGAPRLYLLATAVGDRPETGRFRVGDTVVEVSVESYHAPRGAWDRFPRWQGGRPWRSRVPGFVRPGPIAWLATHRHGRGVVDQPYELCYLYKIRLDPPAGARVLALPDEPSILLFAASAVADPNDDTVAACDLSGGVLA